MIWIAIILGVIIGAATLQFGGAIVGGLLGYLFAKNSELKTQFESLSKRLVEIEQTLNNTLEQKNTEEHADLAESTQSLVSLPKVQENNTPRAQTPTGLVSETTVERETQSPKVIVKPDIPEAPVEYSAAPVKEYPIDKAIKFCKSAIRRYFTEGNIIVRIGIIVLFFGFSFLVKYGIDNALIPIELRLSVITLAAIGMLVLSWKIRFKKQQYALALQGGSIAVLYLVAFSSFRMYQLLPAQICFPILVALSLFGMSLAVLQNSRGLAISAIVGGFICPILTSTGSGSHVALFSYYLILNLAIFGVSWFKSWRALNLIGFAFTFAIGTFWGVTQYQQEHFLSTEPFLILFFLLYVFIAVLFASKQEPKLKAYVDGTLIFGTPLLGFGLQTSIIQGYPYGLAFSSLILGAFYLSLTRFLWRRDAGYYRVLCEALLGLGIIFTTLTIPFALDGRLTAATWAIEGAGFIWIALRQNRQLLMYFGVLIQLAGASLFLYDLPYPTANMLFLNTSYLGVAIITIAALFSAFCFEQFKVKQLLKFKVDIAFIVYALLWWFIGGLLQIEFHLGSKLELTATVLYTALTVAVLLLILFRFQWKKLRFSPWLLTSSLPIFLIIATNQRHIFGDFGALAWCVALGVCYASLYYLEKKAVTPPALHALHVCNLLLLTCVIAFELLMLVDINVEGEAWSMSIAGLTVLGALIFCTTWSKWPSNSCIKAYRQTAAYILIFVLAIWSIFLNFLQFANPAPLTYLPILNPIDLTQALIIIGVLYWLRLNVLIHSKTDMARNSLLAIGFFVFAWFNSMLFKTLHTQLDIPYESQALFSSSAVQMSVSISWSLIGLGIMILATKLSWRQVWIVGASLSAVVVIKLFLLDLSERETVERIVSFLVVGTLLLVVGYFSPVPPKLLQQKQEKGEAERTNNTEDDK